MAATSTNRSRPVAKRRPKVKGATTKAKSATRKATTEMAGRAQTATGSTASRPSDVIALIKADHVAVNQLFKRYSDLGPAAVKGRRQIAERVIKELSVHAAVEEQILYPKVRTAVPNGE